MRLPLRRLKEAVAGNPRSPPPVPLHLYRLPPAAASPCGAPSLLWLGHHHGSVKMSWLQRSSSRDQQLHRLGGGN
jgi:hypothetical protein